MKKIEVVKASGESVPYDMELGDTGYPFEKFVAALLRSEGYETKVGVIVQGHCVTHEVDVVAENDRHHYMCECKFHNSQGRFCNVKNTPINPHH